MFYSVIETRDFSLFNQSAHALLKGYFIIYYKRNRKLVSCVYGVIMHSGNVRRILEKRVEHSATPRVLHASLVFSQHSPRALSHHKCTRLVFYFLSIHDVLPI